MANLKEKILQSLKNTKQVETTLNTIAKSQENLLKNYSNPVFNQKDRGKLLKSYIDLQDVGKSLYRYNILQEHNYLNDAEEEKGNIESKVLKGGVSYNKYVWHSENGEHTCEYCADLDGQEFDYYDEVPERPHPNCRCTVEIIEGEIETDGEEPQDNKDKIPPRVPTPQPPNPKPIPNPESSPQPTPQPKTPPQTQKWIMPCNGPIVGQYGEPRSTHIHNGIDIAVPVGTPIKAIADGTVVVTGPVSGYGYWVGISHGLVNGVKVSSEYGHLSKWVVNNGQHVKQGQIIAYSGNTGYSQGPHLHLTIRHGNPGKGGGTAVNPWIYIGN